MILSIGLFTLGKFVSETIGNSDMTQFLDWPPWAMPQEIETISSVSRNQRRPKQVLFCVAGAGIIMHTLPMETLRNSCCRISKDSALSCGCNLVNVVGTNLLC